MLHLRSKRDSVSLVEFDETRREYIKLLGQKELYWKQHAKPKKQGHGYGHGDTTQWDTGTRQISKTQDTDTTRTRHNKIK